MNGRLIHQAVEHQAEIRPHATALIYRDERISYRTLNAAADEYAARLADLGVGPGRILPVRLPRSARFVAVLLAALKCGAGYAALDPRWPSERVSTLLQQLEPPLLVTDSSAPDRTFPSWRPPLERLSEAAGRGGRPPRTTVSPSAPATVFFTSGTTGAPKGVVSPHRATTRLFPAGGPLEFGPWSVMPQAASAPWDAASLELWGMLLTGGTSILLEDDHLLPDTLQHLIRTESVDTVWLTASLFNLFVEADIKAFSGSRRVLIGGERLSPTHVRSFLSEHPDIALVNGYGPVESCVFATTHPIRPEDCDRPTGIPIGRPVPRTDVYVLDGDRACAPGSIGELCIGGDGLAIGYLGDPELTDSKFVVVDICGAMRRVYRTGDLGRVDAAGVFHFHGRADRQVKIHGHRIEPAEIEHAALRVPGVVGCIAVPIPDAAGGFERLALFYTATTQDRSASTSTQDPLRVRQMLVERLPSHLVPNLVRRVDSLPVTAYGKVDSQRLLGTLVWEG